MKHIDSISFPCGSEKLYDLKQKVHNLGGVATYLELRDHGFDLKHLGFPNVSDDTKININDVVNFIQSLPRHTFILKHEPNKINFFLTPSKINELKKDPNHFDTDGFAGSVIYKECDDGVHLDEIQDGGLIFDYEPKQLLHDAFLHCVRENKDNTLVHTWELKDPHENRLIGNMGYEQGFYGELSAQDDPTVQSNTWRKRVRKSLKMIKNVLRRSQWNH